VGFTQTPLTDEFVFVGQSCVRNRGVVGVDGEAGTVGGERSHWMTSCGQTLANILQMKWNTVYMKLKYLMNN